MIKQLLWKEVQWPLQLPQKGQQVHFSHKNLQNLIQYFVDWRIKPFARISSLCLEPCCRKQIFLGCVEFGRDPPSFYALRKKSKSRRKKRFEMVKRSLFKVEYQTQKEVSESKVQNFWWPSAETNTDSLFVICWNLSPPTSLPFQHLSLWIISAFDMVTPKVCYCKECTP